jgi:uncharacterized repeat protein (TIGR03803 family)
MSNLSSWKKAPAIIVLCAATAIAAQAQTFTTLANLPETENDPAYPYLMSLVQGVDGNLYGTTKYGGTGFTDGSGAIFKVTQTGTLTTLYGFCGIPGCKDGVTPFAGLALATDGNFYGTATAGGFDHGGTVFRISSQGVFKRLYDFCARPNCTDGEAPEAPVVQGGDGSLYGTTANGGNSNCGSGCGTVFKIASNGKLTTLYAFCAQTNCPDGAYPSAGLVLAADGNFYGTTLLAGDSGNCCGTVFKITPQGKLTTLHKFTGDGAHPYGKLLQASDGNFYGTTFQGGAHNQGTVFKMTPERTLTILYSFCSLSNCADGGQPYAGLVQGTDGNFYGTTYSGGTICSSCGTVFQITSAGTLSTLHSFDLTDGASPFGGLIQATSGRFYGTTYEGGSDSGGTIFSLDMGLGPFVSFVHNPAKVGQIFGVLGQGFTGTTAVSLNGIPAKFTVISDTLLEPRVPAGATTGYVTVTTPSGTLTSNVPFHVLK